MDKATLRKNVTARMEGALKSLDNELKGLRTGRASINFLDPVTVEAYGSRSPISQVATISVPEPRIIMVQVWDKGLVKAVEKAITDANLGVNPMIEGQMIRLPIPILSEERRKELVKLAHKYGETNKISLRNIRRDTMEELKKLEKDKVISEDIQFNLSEELQKLTDEFTAKVDANIKQKEHEVLNM